MPHCTLPQEIKLFYLSKYISLSPSLNTHDLYNACTCTICLSVYSKLHNA